MLEKKILIIEDEDSLLKTLAERFGMEGFTVLEALDGEEGLRKAREEHPNLILLDVIMPKMDGMTMLEKLREDEWGKTVPVILLTNLSDGRKVAEALEQGVYDYLVKADWTLEDLVKKVKERLGEG